MSKINRNDVIGPLTAEQANHLWQILHDAGETLYRSKSNYDFKLKDMFFVCNAKSYAWGSRDDASPTISYEDFVAKMSTPDPKWLNTKRDVSEVENPNQNTFDHECWQHYSTVTKNCIKCHGDPRDNKKLYGILREPEPEVKDTTLIDDGIIPPEFVNIKDYVDRPELITLTYFPEITIKSIHPLKDDRYVIITKDLKSFIINNDNIGTVRLKI